LVRNSRTGTVFATDRSVPHCVRTRVAGPTLARPNRPPILVAVPPGMEASLGT
jgi:hypothetical protein